jgi:hypothetical protein
MGSCSNYHQRSLIACVGTPELRVPQDHVARFSTGPATIAPRGVGGWSADGHVCARDIDAESERGDRDRREPENQHRRPSCYLHERMLQSLFTFSCESCSVRLLQYCCGAIHARHIRRWKALPQDRGDIPGPHLRSTAGAGRSRSSAKRRYCVVKHGKLDVITLPPVSSVVPLLTTAPPAVRSPAAEMASR